MSTHPAETQAPSPATNQVPRLPVVDRRAWLVDAVRGHSILSIGLGGYSDDRSYSYNLKTADLADTISGAMATAASAATFADLSAEAIEAFRSCVKADYHRVDITAPPEEWPADLVASRFDVVIVGEVLEHLDNPGAGLRSLYPLVAEGGRLIVTVPNAYPIRAITNVIRGREETHPEHASHYSYMTLRRLLEMNDMPSPEIFWYRWTVNGGTLYQRSRRRAAAAVAGLLPQLSHGLIAVVHG